MPTSTNTCLFGGALLAAGLTASVPQIATAQCNPTVTDTVDSYSVAVDPSGWENNWTALGFEADRLYTVLNEDIFNDDSGAYEQSTTINVWDISNPNNVTVIGSAEQRFPGFFSDTAEQVIPLGNTLIGARDDKLVFLDITSFSSPIEIATFQLPGEVQQLNEADGLVFAGVGVGSHSIDSIHVIDPSDPAAPVELGSVNGPFSTVGKPVFGELPALNPAGDTLLLLDVSDPANITTLGSVSGVSGHLLPPVIVGTNVAVLGQTKHVIDITDPTNPSIIGTFASDGLHAVASGSFIYAVDGSGRLNTVDFTDPANPITGPRINPLSPLGGQDSTGNRAVGLSGGKLVWFGQQSRLIQIADVSSCSLQPTVLTSPASRIGEPGGPATVMTVIANDAQVFEWRLDGVAVADGPNYSGATTDTLTVTPNASTEGVYVCYALNVDGSDNSLPAVFGVRPDNSPEGIVDINGDGIIDNGDIGLFVSLFLAATG